MVKSELKLANWWDELENGKVLCTLCPRYCKIGKGQSGFCFIRQNIDGKLYSAGYGRPTGFAVDPIEKKPLNHFFPGSSILSFGTAGCNLGCKFCQNWSMSKSRLDDLNAMNATPEQVVDLAIRRNVPSIAYTYNDPTIFGEYVRDISRIGRDKGIKSVMVTSGYIDKEARKDVYKYIDAANVDLKAFTETFYHKLTFSHLGPVLDTLKWLRHETDIWFEITTLLIPGENDSQDEIKKMCEWVLNNLGDEIPLHFTAFHPDFKMRDKNPTPPSTLKSARTLALSMGIKYCYVGNVHDSEGQTTYCPECHTTLIERDWHTVFRNKIQNGLCPECRTPIAGLGIS
ncbi:MAG: AmmeMemoRadiSam system radical SAM enzyme [Calditrichaceae bacterium]